MNHNIKKYGLWIVLALVIIVILFLLQKFRSGYETTTTCPPGEYTVMVPTCKPIPTPPPSSPPCDAGSYSPNGYQPGCMPCPANTFCPEPGMTKPNDCQPDYISPPGSRTATACQPSKCPAGYYSLTGSSPCTPCPANTFCPEPGTTTPQSCPAGSTSQPGSTLDTACI